MVGSGAVLESWTTYNIAETADAHSKFNYDTRQLRKCNLILHELQDEHERLCTKLRDLTYEAEIYADK